MVKNIGGVIVAGVFEILMLICFGASWPINAVKSYKARTTKGKSIVFLFAIFIGYIFGILAKLLSTYKWYVMFFYILNIMMVSVDILLYFRNRKIDRQNLIK